MAGKIPKAYPLLATMGLLLAAMSLAAIPGPAFSKDLPRKLTICKNTMFALCAASTCTDLGTKIKNNEGKRFDAVSCTCPILTGDNIADLNGGNMQGSCTSPDSTVVYSTFEFNDSFPQDINGTWTADVPAIPEVCPADNSYSQCWNWSCTVIPSENGIPLAQCTCPMQKTRFSFITQAGQQPSACTQLPVGGPLFFDPSATIPHSGH